MNHPSGYFGGITLPSGKRGFAVYKDGKIVTQYAVMHTNNPATPGVNSVIQRNDKQLIKCRTGKRQRVSAKASSIFTRGIKIVTGARHKTG